MNIDVKTLFYIFCLGNYFIIFFLSVYVIFYKVKNPILYIFIISKILYGIMWILFALRLEIPWFYTVIIPNIFLIFAIFLDLYCIIYANEKFKNKHFKNHLVIPILFSLIFIIFSGKQEYIRIIIMSFFIAFLYAAGGILLLIKSKKTKIQSLVYFLCFIIAFTFFYRGIWAFFKDTDVVLYTSMSLQIISYLLLVIGSFSFPMILLLILKEVDEEEIQIDNKTLKQLNENKSKFLSIIAHDLKGPLGTYNHLIEVLLNRHNEMLPVKREEFINKLQDSSKQTFSLLENLLQWSRAEYGTLIVHPQHLNLNDITNSVISLMKHSIELKHLNLTVNIHEEITIYCDYNMIMTVIRNLISNAIKFTPNNGNISITSIITNSNFVELCIQDSGVGISKENLKAIFDVHSEIRTKGTNDEDGTGLGLKLVHEFIKKNNGKIEIESKETIGTKVCVYLPTIT